MIQLRNGDILRFQCTFTHQGIAYNQAAMYCALGVQGATFTEKLFTYQPITGITNDLTPKQYILNVDVLIKDIGTIGFPAAPGYECYVKIMQTPHGDVLWWGPLDDIELLADGPAVFSNLVVVYAKA